MSKKRRMLIFCYKCGTEISDGAVFCHKCGAKMLTGNKEKEMTDSSSMLQNNGALQEELHQGSTMMNEQDVEVTKDLQSKEDGFREFVNGYVRRNTAFQTAEELLGSQVPSRFVQICYGVPAVYMVYLIISLLRDPGFTGNIILNILGFIFIAFIIGYLAAHLVGGIKKIKYVADFSGEMETPVDGDELIQFLNEKLAYLSRYFNEWGYLRQSMNFMIGGAPVAEIDITGSKEITFCSEFGERKTLFSVIYVRPDPLAPDSERRKYSCNVKLKKADIRCEKYACAVKTAPILQAAMEYYLKEYRPKE